MISEEDFSLFRITYTVDEAIQEITNFYRVFHSQRYVRDQLALRLHTPLSDALLQRVSDEFSDILVSGKFKQGSAHSHEANEPSVAHLPRLYFHFDRRSHGRLRQMIDLINREA